MTILIADDTRVLPDEVWRDYVNRKIADRGTSLTALARLCPDSDSNWEAIRQGWRRVLKYGKPAEARFIRMLCQVLPAPQPWPDVWPTDQEQTILKRLRLLRSSSPEQYETLLLNIFSIPLSA